MTESATTRLTASQEDYLEAVLELCRERGAAQVRDIAARLGVSMPSVTGALHKLARLELVNYTPYRTVTLSERGRERAEIVQRRHEALDRFLVDLLGLEAEVAGAMACRMEHTLDGETLARLKALVDYATGEENRAFLKGLRRATAAAGRRARRSEKNKKRGAEAPRKTR
jgi:DtxR family Mn-dependent transcriptional regulator